MMFVVNVPVLSVQIIETLPNVSTDGSFFTMALRLAIRSTPRASVTVTTIGNPSGIAATASETEKRNKSVTSVLQTVIDVPPIVNISSQLRCCNTPMTQMKPITAKDIADSFFASSSIDNCKGVLRSPICHQK